MAIRHRTARQGTRLLLAASLALAAACSRRDAAPAVDSTLDRDLAMAGRAAPAFIPADTALHPTATAKPTPRAPTVRTSTPRPTAQPRPANPTTAARAPVSSTPSAPTPTHLPDPMPAPPAETPASSSTGSRGSGLAGTSLAMSTGSRVCTNARPGDKLVAHVGSSSGPGAGMIPAGSTVVLEVAELQVNDGSPEQSRIVFRIRQISVGDVDYPGNGVTVASEGALQKTNMTSGKSDAKKAAAGAIAGAILGQVLSHDTKGTVIGAAAGAAGGAVVGRATRKYEGCLPAGASLRVTLS